MLRVFIGDIFSLKELFLDATTDKKLNGMKLEEIAGHETGQH